MRKALITGISGQDGYYLANQLRENGWMVHGISRSGENSNGLSSDVHIHAADIQRHSRVAGLLREIQPDVLFNLAGISSVAQSWERPIETAEINAVGVVNLLDEAFKLEATLGRQVRIIQASSAEIFGQVNESPQTEQTHIAPISPYGAAKAFAHEMVAAYRAKGLFASSAILYNHESPRRPESFVSRKITMTVAKISLGLTDSLALGSLSVQRDWGWAPDYTSALVKMATAEEAGDFIVATGEGHTLREFVQAAFFAAGIVDWEKYVTEDPRFFRPVDPMLLVGDSSKARRMLNWEPTCTFEDLVSRMVNHDINLLSNQTSHSGKE